MKRILVVSDNDLLLVGIERLLKRIVDLSIHMSVTQDEEEIIRHIQETNPEVIIVDGSFEKNGSLQLTRLLNSKKVMRLLIMNIDSNHIQIYDKREVSLEHTADLTAYM